MNQFVASALCEGWSCAFFYILFALPLLVGLVLILVLGKLIFNTRSIYIKSKEQGDTERAEKLKKRTIILLIGIPMLIIVGNIINQVYLAFKK